MSQRICVFFPDNPGEKLPIPLNIWICSRAPKKKQKMYSLIESPSNGFPIGENKQLISKSRGKNAEKQCYNVYCMYPPVIQHSHGKSPFIIGKPSINGPFSMAMLNNQRVYCLKIGKCRVSIHIHHFH
jgi:hypothetical protein